MCRQIIRPELPDLKMVTSELQQRQRAANGSAGQPDTLTPDVCETETGPVLSDLGRYQVSKGGCGGMR